MPSSTQWFSCILFCSSTPALAFPDEESWADLLDQSGDILADELDTVRAPDLVGTSDSSEDKYGAVAQWYADESNLYVRVRMDKDPTDDPYPLQEDAWAILIDVDDDLAAYEFSIVANDLGSDLTLWENTTDDGEDWSDTPETELYSWSSPFGDTLDVEDWNTGTDGFDGDPDYWLMFKIDRSVLADHSSIQSTSSFRLAFASDSNDESATAMTNDLAGADNLDGSPSLADAFSAQVCIDEDDDGLTLFEEEEAGTDPANADTDGDGLSDAEELTLGTDPLNADTDGDGVDDGDEIEAGTDPLDADSDDDGLSDGEEHEAGTDPLDEDSDDDGIWDIDEVGCDLKGTDGDRDGDGIDDVFEGLSDTDGDGQSDFCDDDDDNDGIPTSTEGDVDTDEDGTADYKDTDSDDDGVLDADEGTDDDDCDDVANYVDSDDQDGPCGDPDEDGLTNAEEEDCGTDPDNPDTDGDGLLDGDEDCNEDSDGDGINDALDPDSNGDDGNGGDALDSGGDGNLDFTGGHYTGGSCSAAPLGSALMPAFLAGLAGLRRRRERPVPNRSTPSWLIRGGLLSLFIPASAKAQEIDAQRFSPAVGNQTFVLIEESRLAPAPYGTGLWFNYADDPLVYRYDDGTEEVVLSQVATTDLVAWGRIGPVQLGLDLPLHLHALGHGIETDTPYTLGDLQIRGRVEILDGPIQLGLSAWAGAPTGNGRAWLGEPGMHGGALASIGTEIAPSRPIQLGAHLGFQGGASEPLDDLSWGSRAVWAAGAQTVLSSELDLSVSAEFTGEMLMGSSGAPGALPAEGLLAFHLDRGSISSTLGLSKGLSTGVGSPDYRVVMGIRVQPSAVQTPVPDLENGQTQTHIQIQNESGLPVAGALIELLAGPEEELGRWTAETGVLVRNLLPGAYRVLVVSDGYGALTTSIRVPDQETYQPEPLTLFTLNEKSQVLFLVRDSQGRVIDGAKAVNQANPSQVIEISDGTGMVTLEPDSYSWTITADGYQAVTSPARVSKGSTASVSVTLNSIQAGPAPGDEGCLTGDYIRISGTSDLVFFDTGEHVLRPDALNVLNSVARCITEHPEIARLEVIGHADPRGEPAANLALSERRAAQVAEYLKTRLSEPLKAGLIIDSRGMGEAQLLQSGNSQTALQTDRRVEFRVHMADKPEVPAP